MNFLELCRATAQDAGVVAGLPTFSTVNGVTGRVAQLVGWVRDGWIDIQNEREDWLWMRRKFGAAGDVLLSPGNTTYTAIGLNLTRVARWEIGTPTYHPMSIYDTDIGRADESPLPWIPYPAWMERYDRGVHDHSRPTCWSTSPQGELLFGPTPDKAYAIRGGYVVTPQELAADTDIPEMPAQFHRVIMAEAIALMSQSDEVAETMVSYKNRYERLRQALVNSQTGTPSMGGYPLA